MNRILICDHSPDVFLDEMTKRGFEIDYQPEISNSEFQAFDDNFESVLIKSSLILDKTFINAHGKLKLILRPGSGLDNVDCVHAENSQIAIINSPEGNCNAVGEHVTALLLNLINHIPRAIQQVQNQQWVREENRGLELEGRKVAIIGVGRTGTAVFKKLKGFDVEYLPHDKYKSYIETIGRNSVSLEQVYEEAEIVTLHLPLNFETKEFADQAFFSKFKKPVYFVNASRGGVLNEEALLEAIDNGKVIAAALDVLQKEPMMPFDKNSPTIVQRLLDTKRVIITPHIAGWTQEAKQKMFQILIEKYDMQFK